MDNTAVNNIKTDSAKDIKSAFALLAQDVVTAIGSERVSIDSKKLVLTVKCPDKDVRIAVKKGCSGLGRKNSEGEWVYPEDDLVLYTPFLDPQKPFRQQFRVFEKGEFLKMWQDLDLVRYKVSTSGVKHIRDTGIDGPVSVSQYADYISVQSFSNSVKKTRALMAYFETKPLAIEHSFYKRFFGVDFKNNFLC